MGGTANSDARAAQNAALARVDWEDAFTRAVRFARSRGASPEDAMDHAQSAIVGILSGAPRWDPSLEPDVGQYLRGVVRSLMSHARARREEGREASAGILEDAPAPISDRAPAPVREARYSAALARLRAELSGDVYALAVLDLTVDGVDKPAEIAERLGVDVGVVYDARDRIGRHARRIAKMAGELETEVAP